MKCSDGLAPRHILACCVPHDVNLYANGAAMELNNKPVPKSGATYRFYHRPEGWSATCEVGDYHVTVSFYATEAEAISALNKALGDGGMMAYRFNGGL